jgi:copper(I)-binding protein
MNAAPRRAAVLGVLAVLLTGAVAPAARAADDATGGGPEARDAWARATPPGTSVAAVYVTLAGGARDDRLVGASTERAAMTQLHAVTEAAGMARMRATDGIAVPAGKTVVLGPQGLHLMLMDLRQPLVAGDRFDLTLRYATAGTRVVRVAVIGPDQPAPTGH